MARQFSIRAATNNDHTDILSVLEEVAPEIPVSLEGTARLEAIKSIIVECCDSGDSLVVTDEAETVVGFVLAKPDRDERFFNDNNALSLRYVGVAKGFRGIGVFSSLLEEMKVAGEPLTADVLNGNQAGMADRLLKAGFVEVKSTSKEKSFKWTASAR